MMITTMSQLEELESLRNELELFDCLRSSSNVVNLLDLFYRTFFSSPLHMHHDELYDVQARARVSV